MIPMRLPQETIDRILLRLDTPIILILGEENVSQHVWLCKKDKNLTEACESENIIGIQYLIDNNGDIYDPIILQDTENECLDTITYLIKYAGTNIRASYEYALYIGAVLGSLQVVKFATEQGDAYAHAKSALCFAAKNGHINVVKYLIEKCNVNIHVSEDVALRISAKNGHLSVVKYLIDSGADIHADNDAALRGAAENGYLHVIKYLLKHGANIHARDDSALCISIIKGHTDIVKYLIDKGANIYASEDRALNLSIEYRHLDIVKCLVEHGADINYALYSSIIKGYLDIIKYLIEKGADINYALYV